MKLCDVLDILKPYNNDRLSLMSKKDLYYLKACLKNYYLDMRESLNLSKDITFGIEIEVEHIKEGFYVLEKDGIYNGWKFSSDDTLINGREVISPILTDDYNTWQTIKNITQSLGQCSEIFSTCGGHIHIGAQILGSDYSCYENLFNLWLAYENIIFRFGYGEYLSERFFTREYAIPLIDIDNYKVLYNKCGNWALNWSKISNVKDFKESAYVKDCTFEVRSPNGSLNPIIWQNNINFFIKLLEYAKSQNFNETLILDRVEKLKLNLTNYDNILDYYRLIDIEAACELADLIFDNNLDKVYFLRQYIKNEEVGMKAFEKGKKFTNCNYY